MKILLLVRHAKSSWEAPGLSDFDRPLNKRGKSDAPQMAKRLKEKIKVIDLLVSSPARRARKTAKYFAEEYGIKKEEIKLVDQLYGASLPVFENVVSGLPDKDDVVAIFSHNPDITVFANSLTNVRIDDMPTCSLFAVQANINSWSNFSTADKQFLFFDYPKNPLP